MGGSSEERPKAPEKFSLLTPLDRVRATSPSAASPIAMSTLVTFYEPVKDR